MTRSILSTALIALLAACSAERAPATEDTAMAPPVADQPSETVPPATAPPMQEDGPVPAADAPAAPGGDGDLARFDGYGDVKLGTAAADMEAAWGGALNVLGKEANEGCYFMTPKWVKLPAEFNFMIGDGKFARFGTESAKFAAPGGGKVGMSAAEVEALYPGRVQAQPHKYTDGKYLRIEDAASGSALVFETDAAGKVTEWRVGKPPQVDYVEGCS